MVPDSGVKGCRRLTPVFNLQRKDTLSVQKAKSQPAKARFGGRLLRKAGRNEEKRSTKPEVGSGARKDKRGGASASAPGPVNKHAEVGTHTSYTAFSK